MYPRAQLPVVPQPGRPTGPGNLTGPGSPMALPGQLRPDLINAPAANSSMPSPGMTGASMTGVGVQPGLAPPVPNLPNGVVPGSAAAASNPMLSAATAPMPAALAPIAG